MSDFDVKKVTCPHCYSQQNVNVYCSVNVYEDQALKDKVLNKSLFFRKCKNCSKIFMLKHPILYNDPDNNFMVYLIPDIENTKIIDRELENEFSDLKHIRKRIVPSFDDLKEKISIFESGLDDISVEVTKLALHDSMLQRFNEEISNIRFSFCDRNKNTVGFVYLSKGKPTHKSTRLEIYNKASYIVRKTLIRDKDCDGFIKVDYELADTLLYRYNSLKQKESEKQSPKKNNSEENIASKTEV